MLGVRQWLTPDGRLIRHQGIKPDTEEIMPLGSDLLSPGELQSLTGETLQQSGDGPLLRGLKLFQ